MDRNMFSELLLKQEIFDQIVKQKHGLVGKDLINKKIISLEVELSEFANELRFFKYWSNKPANYVKALTEYVDALHFYLSVANDLGVTENDVQYVSPAIFEELPMEQLYINAKEWAFLINKKEPANAFNMSFNWFWGMGSKAGFTEYSIYDEYLNKHRINYERQAEGY